MSATAPPKEIPVGDRPRRRSAPISQSPPMAIVMVTNNALADKMGGHERYVHDLSAALVARGAQVTIVAKSWSGSVGREELPSGVVIDRHPVPSKANPLYAPLYPAYLAAGVAGRVRRRSPGALVHVHMGLPALPVALDSRQRYLFTFHAPVWRELLSERQGSYALPKPLQHTAVGLVRRTESLVARRSAATVVLSEFMRSELRLLDGPAAERAVLVPGAVDDRLFYPAEGDSDRRAERDRISGPVLFTARRLTPRTGVDELIRALALLREEFPKTRLQIAGGGLMEAELRHLAQSLGLGSAVEFLGRVSDQELVRRYREATVVVLPTRELEGFGLTTAEALACGAAVVGTPAGATPELLEPLDPGLVAGDVSAPAMATAVGRLLRDPELLADIRSRAPTRVLPAMSWSRVADRYLELYERLAA